MGIGGDNVFIISKLGDSMKALSETWLHETMDICSRTDIPRANICFCPDIRGRHGKGPLAATNGITHFVDDKDEALLAVYEDPAGNAKAAIEEYGGQLFHFARSGLGDTPPSPHVWSQAARPPCVVPVANWQQL